MYGLILDCCYSPAAEDARAICYLLNFKRIAFLETEPYFFLIKPNMGPYI